MKLEVLGCAGGEGIDYRATSFLINDTLLVDAGAVVNILTLEQQKGIKHALITHPHLDHIKDLGFIADNTFGARTVPLQIISTASVIEALRAHYFNWIIWPDFSQLPSPEKAELEFIATEDGIEIDALKIRFVPVNHPGCAQGFIIEDSDSNVTILVTGDTANTELIWQLASRRKNLKAIFADTAFPDSEQKLADLTGHMTPSQLYQKLNDYSLQHLDVYCYHLKPAYHDRVIEDIESVGLSSFQALQQGQVLTFN